VPVGVAAHGQGRPVVVDGRAHRPGDQRVLAVGPDDQRGRLGDALAPLGAPADAGDPAALDRELLDDELLAHLGPGGPGRLQQQGVKDRPARAVDGVDPLEGGVAALEHDRAGVEPHLPGRGRARGHDLVQQAPAPEPRPSRELHLVGGERVAREGRPVDQQHPEPLAGQQHRRRRAGHPGPDNNHVVHRCPSSPASSEALQLGGRENAPGTARAPRPSGPAGSSCRRCRW
jgi:hypothetical protein